MTDKTQRKNLLKLAVYLETLPRNYKHFDMEDYADHRGECELPETPLILAAKKPKFFLNNCGTVACAAGHGPAAGIRFLADEKGAGAVYWSLYVGRAFGAGDCDPHDGAYNSEIFNFLFSDEWKKYDNHHYGAAARIRYFLATGKTAKCYMTGVTKLYAPYRKGSRSAVRRELEAAQ